MEEKIRVLEVSLNKIYVEYMVFQRRNNIEEIGKLMPQIQEFTMWFLEGNRFGIKKELYQDMSRNLLDILKDMTVAMECGDRVLLHDAAAYGFSEYLRLFLPERESEDHEDNL